VLGTEINVGLSVGSFVIKVGLKVGSRDGIVGCRVVGLIVKGFNVGLDDTT